MQTVIRFSRSNEQNGNKKAVTKTDQPCLRFFWKVMLVGYVTAERICKNMLYSIVGIDYHKNRVVSTKSFENTLLSAECKKTHGKLWQKREDWTVPALLTRQQQPKSFIPTLKPSSSRFRPGLQNALAIRKEPCYNAAVIESEIFRAGCDSLPVVQPTSRKA